MRETFKCPRCKGKLLKGLMNCPVCGLNFAKLRAATNTEAKIAIKNREFDRVVYTTDLPSDLKYKSLLLSVIFGGMFGAHKFLTGKIFTGLIYAIISFVSVVMISLIAFGVVAKTVFVSNLEIVISVCFAIVFLIYLKDLFLIIFKLYKIPVALPYKD